jgi:hypothetical protein
MMRRRIPLIAVIATVISSGLLLATAGAAPTARSCGTMRVRQGNTTLRYSVKVTKGSVSCTSAKLVIWRFVRTSRDPSGWSCSGGWARDSRCKTSHRAVNASYLGRTGDMSR